LSFSLTDTSVLYLSIEFLLNSSFHIALRNNLEAFEGLYFVLFFKLLPNALKNK